MQPKQPSGTSRRELLKLSRLMTDEHVANVVNYAAPTSATPARSR
jgi:hypothetical protein